MGQKWHTSALKCFNNTVCIFQLHGCLLILYLSFCIVLYMSFTCIIKPFLSHFCFLSSVLVLNTSSHVPNLFFNNSGAKKERKRMQKIDKKDSWGLIKDFLQYRMETDAHSSQTGFRRFLSQFANYCPLLKTVDFLEDIFCLFPYSLLTEQHIVLIDVCAWWAGELERIKFNLLTFK